jgi:TPR repeat protein
MKSLNACRAGSIVALFVLLHLTAFQVLAADAPAAAPAEPASAKSFDDQLVQANVLFKQGKLDEAFAAAAAARKLDPKRFEAAATAALILHAAHKPAEARAALDEAFALAPTDKQDKLRKIAALLTGAPGLSTPAAGGPATNAPSLTQLTGAARRQFDTLTMIIEEADKAKLDAERKKLLREFLEKSEQFIKENPDYRAVWALRAIAAIELNQKRIGWEAGKELKRLGADNSEDPKLRKVMAALDRKGWLVEQLPVLDYGKLSVQEAQNVASEGDVKAETFLGNHYQREAVKNEDGSDDQKRNYAQAVYWYRKATESGDPEVQFSLGAMMILGIGASQDYDGGLTLLQALAQTNYPPALYMLGWVAVSGILDRGTKNVMGKDPERGIKLLRRASDCGEAYAPKSLAACYEEGKGVTRDHVEAAKWYREGIKRKDGYMVRYDLARLLATSPQAEARNGKEAVEQIQQSIKLSASDSQFQDPTQMESWRLELLDVLAAAYAEAGDFDNAIKMGQEAIKLAKGHKTGLDSKLVNHLLRSHLVRLHNWKAV